MQYMYMAKMAASSWNDDETFKLIALWGDSEILAKLEGCKCNKEVYDRGRIRQNRSTALREGKKIKKQV